MAYTRVKLIDPSFGLVGNLGTYDWEVNYNSESEFGAQRNVDSFQNTSGTGFIIQQGDDQPIAISVSGKFFTKAQHQKFVAFYKRSQFQTMVFEDFEGAQYEVMITAYKPQRVRTQRNPRGNNEDNRLHYYEYTMEMLVLNVISGDWTAH